MNALAGRIGKGLAVDTAIGALLRAGSFAVTVAVARTLTVAEFGAISLVLVIFGITETLTGLSLETALSRRPTLPDDVVNVAWTLSLLRSIVLGGAIFAAAPLISAVWGGETSVTNYLRIMSFGTVGAALANAHAVKFQREQRFDISLVLSNARLLLGTLFSLALLLITSEPAALVLGPTLGNFCHSALTWALVSPRPRLAWSSATVKELFSFGRWVFGRSVLLYLLLTLDSLYVGQVLGHAALGAYSLGWRITNTAMTFLTRSLGRMLIPAYASLQTEQAAMNAVAIRGLSATGAFGAFGAAAVWVFSRDILTIVGGADSPWQTAVPVMQALTVLAFTRIIANVMAPMFYAAGEPKQLALISGLQLLLLLPALHLGAHFFGLPGVAAAVSGVAALGTLIVAIAAQRTFQLGLARQMAALLPPFAICVGAGFLASRVTATVDTAIVRLILGTGMLGVLFIALWEGFRVTLPRRWSTYPSLVRPLLQAVQTKAGWRRSPTRG